MRITFGHVIRGDRRDNTCMDRSTSAGGIIVNSRGEIVLAEQRGPSWSLPKGHVESGETPLAAALREVEEETGLADIHYEGALPVYRRGAVSDDAEGKTIYPFLFTTESTAELKPTDPDNPHAEWMTVDRAMELLPHPADRQLLEQARQRIEHLAEELRKAAPTANV